MVSRRRVPALRNLGGNAPSYGQRLDEAFVQELLEDRVDDGQDTEGVAILNRHAVQLVRHDLADGHQFVGWLVGERDCGGQVHDGHVRAARLDGVEHGRHVTDAEQRPTGGAGLPKVVRDPHLAGRARLDDPGKAH